MSKIVEFFTPEGEVTQYRPLSARLPTFLAVYGPERGFSVDTEIVDSLSLKPGLLKLYEIVLHAGRKPEEAGLPPLNGTGQTLVGRATLRDREGRVLATATAAKPIQSYKDLEVLETAARQRLLAALGFGGEVLDTDEILDQTDQGLAPRPPVPVSSPDSVSVASPVVAEVAEVAEEKAIPASVPPAVAPGSPGSPEPCPVTPASHPDPEAAVDATLPATAHADSPATPTSDRAAAALAALIRQIDQQSRLRGIEPPVVTTRDEARAALQRLLRRV
ncbi:MAG: hypothetical protein KDJ54_19985 [Candidatus Competibacteraceae bacterium]|nr:hypothetical protein [Candidatus Competibacteraceae bacterium]